MATDSTIPPAGWDDVRARLDRLIGRLRAHRDDLSAAGPAHRADLEEAARALVSAVEDAVAAGVAALRDPTLRDDVIGLADAVRGALMAGVTSAGTQVRARVPGPVGARGTASTNRPAGGADDRPI
jgi:hypothetical protein